MNVYEIIKEAIQNKQQIIAIYQGHERKMCPHVIGVNKEGKEQALFYQFGGTSSSGSITPNSRSNWRCIPIQGLSDVVSQSGEWHTGVNHSRPQTCVDNVDEDVDI